ncbi:MAG: glycine cleavage T protein (aminomethyl transferase), partial [Deltaproteobacteria bacterium]
TNLSAIKFYNFEYGKFADVDMILSRTGYTGETGFEFYFRGDFNTARKVWDSIMEAGKEFGIRPFGLEAQFVLRLEKGHIIIGQETEQRVNLLDLGLGFLWDRRDKASKKIGAPALAFTEGQSGRLKLVGFRMNNPSKTPGDGSVVHEGNEVVGFVCTSRFSPTLRQSIGMALVRDDLAKKGKTLHIYQNDSNKPLRYTATVVPMPFYDPEGKRVKS